MQFSTIVVASLASVAFAAPLPQFDIGALLGGGGGAGGLDIGSLLGSLGGGGGGGGAGGFDFGALLGLLGPPPTAEQQASLASLAAGMGDFLGGVLGTNDNGQIPNSAPGEEYGKKANSTMAMGSNSTVAATTATPPAPAMAGMSGMNML